MIQIKRQGSLVVTGLALSKLMVSFLGLCLLRRLFELWLRMI
jgi:hypothetical protein